MKEYLVYAEDYPDEGLFLIKANNAKEAINKVFDSKFKCRNERIRESNKRDGYQAWMPFYKSTFKAKNIELLHKEYGEIVECDGGGWIG